MCPLSGTLVVAGTAGQVIIAKFDTEVLDGPLKVVPMNIVCDRDGFVWKGHNQLAPKTGKCTLQINRLKFNAWIPLLLKSTTTNSTSILPVAGYHLPLSS